MLDIRPCNVSTNTVSGCMGRHNTSLVGCCMPLAKHPPLPLESCAIIAPSRGRGYGAGVPGGWAIYPQGFYIHVKALDSPPYNGGRPARILWMI